MIKGLISIFVFFFLIIFSIVMFVLASVMNIFHRKRRNDVNTYSDVRNEDYVVVEDGEDEFLQDLSDHMGYRKEEKIIPDDEGEYIDYEEIKDNENDKDEKN